MTLWRRMTTDRCRRKFFLLLRTKVFNPHSWFFKYNREINALWKNKPPLLGRSEACFFIYSVVPACTTEIKQFYCRTVRIILRKRGISFMELKEQISKILSLGMTNAVLASNIGIASTTLSRWYKNGQNLNEESMRKIQNYVDQVKQLLADL